MVPVVGQEQEPVESQQPPLTELNKRFARLNYQLAQVELKIAQHHDAEFTRRIAEYGLLSPKDRANLINRRQLPSLVLERLNFNLAVAREILDHAESGSTDRAEKVKRRSAEEKIRLAELRLESEGVAGKNKHVTDVEAVAHKLEMDRLRIMRDLARVRADMPEHPQYLVERVDILQWQIDRLGDQFMMVDQRLEAIEERLMLINREMNIDRGFRNR